MSLKMIQPAAADFVREHRLETPVPCRLLDLQSDVGELAKAALAATSWGREPTSDHG